MNLRLSGFVAVSAVLHLALLTLVLSIQPDSAVADTASVTLHVVEAAPYLSAIPRPDSAEVSKAVSEPKPKPEPEPIPVYKSVPTLAPKPMPAPRPETKPLPVQQADTVSEAGSSIKTPDAEKPVESSGIGSASESSFKPASDLINPAPKTPIQPAYPAAARKNGIEGSVLLELTVDEHGNVAPYAQLPVRFALEGAAELVGPSVVTAEGGMTGTYVKTTGETGTATLTITTAQTEPVTVVFQTRN